MERDILVLCDLEEEYAQHMTEYLNHQENIPWEIHTYTKVEELLKHENDREISMLVIAESVYEKIPKVLHFRCMVILSESGTVRWEKENYVDKYQRADLVFKNLLAHYADSVSDRLPHLLKGSNTRFIGMYSPVKRCLQTTFAITLSQLLAQERKVLYLNFEHYAGISELLPDMQTRDLADLMYFLNADAGKFYLRFRTIVQRKGNMDYVPPMKSGQNLLTIPAKEWLDLLKKLVELGEYDYVIMDLSESMQGLFDILRSCCRVYTLLSDEQNARNKIMQYEQILSMYRYEDVLSKTYKCNLPKIRSLPQELEQYTRGDLALYVKKQIQDM